MKYLAPIFGLLLWYTNAAAQTPGPWFVWAKGASAVTYQPTGNGLVIPRQAVGTYRGKALWGTLQNPKHPFGGELVGDVRLALYDATGQELQATTITGNVSVIGLQAATDGTWYVLGLFQDTVVFPNGLQLINDSTAHGQRHFIAKLDAALQAVWITPTNTTGYNDTYCFALADDGVYYPVDSGNTTSINRLDYGTGRRTRLWTQNFTGGTESIQVGPDGGVYLSGIYAYSNSAPLFNGTPVPYASYPYGQIHYIVHYRRTGQYHWHQWSRCDNYARATHTLQLGPGNTVYYTGMQVGPAALAGYTASAPSALDSNYLLAKLDSTGALLWASQRPVSAAPQGKVVLGHHYYFNTVLPFCAVTDSALYLFSETEGTSVWGGGITTNATQGSQATVTAFGLNGAPRWAKLTGAAFTDAQQIVADNDMLWMTGIGRDSSRFQFDNVKLPVPSLQYTPYLAALKLRTFPTAGVEASTAGSEALTLWPNPARDRLHIQTPAAGTLRLLDASGAVVRERAAPGAGSLLIIPVADLARGLYFAEFRSAGGTWAQRVVVD